MLPTRPQIRRRHADAQLDNIDQQIAGLKDDMAFVDKRRTFLIAEIAEARNSEHQVRWLGDNTSMRSLVPEIWAEQQNPGQEIKFYLETSTPLPGGGRLYGEQLLVDEVFFTCMTGFKAKGDGHYIEILTVLLRKMDRAAENGRAALHSLHKQQQVHEQRLARFRWQAAQEFLQSPKALVQVEEIEFGEEESDGNLAVLAAGDNAVAERRQRGSSSGSIGSFGSITQFLNEAFVRHDSDDDEDEGDQMVDEKRKEIEAEECKTWNSKGQGARDRDLAELSRDRRVDSLFVSNLF